MLVFVTLLFSVLCVNVNLVLVRVEEGLLRGEIRNKSTGNGEYYSFKGVPYAAPPVGELRFKAPKPALYWEGVKLATEHGPICPQVKLRHRQYLAGNDDCLSLNVYTPTMDPNASLSVMVYIHGGAFSAGNSGDYRYGPDFLLDHNVVVVTLNHRLGALGYLCLDTKEVPGNAGLKDQVQALRWVKMNIKQFGGDPSSITIFGQSSGGASVCLHTLSPMSNGLFRRAIMMGGSCFSGRASAFEPKRHSLLLTHKVGLYTTDPQQALRFLQNTSVEAIVMAMPTLLTIDMLNDKSLQVNIFSPVIENNFGDEHFMLEHPEKLLLEGKTNDVDVIVGHTANEGVGSAVAEKGGILETLPYFKELLLPLKIYRMVNEVKILELADRIYKHYFGDKEISEANFEGVINYYTYARYVYDSYRFLEMWTKFTMAGKRSYCYIFRCFSERNLLGITGMKYGIKEATHVDDLLYIFDWKKSNLALNKNSSSYAMIVQTCKLFTNFAKYGNPTPDLSMGVTWPHYHHNRSLLNINLALTVGPVPSEEMDELSFWDDIYSEANIYKYRMQMNASFDTR